MNREDVMKMAQEAGIVVTGEAVWKLCELVAAAEREACAQIAHDTYEGFGVNAQGVDFVKQRIIEAIRARGQA
jgi:hypothetical protein